MSPSTIVRFENVTKTFPGVIANRDVSLEVRAGETIALLGENGAGKTTLMNILYGLYRADGGRMLLREQPFDPHSPRDAIAAGVGMVHQHFMLVPSLTVVENVVVGLHERGRDPRLSLAQASERVRALSLEYGLPLDPERLVSDLSVGEQQRVEIVKALYRSADVLILDEPTAVLSSSESSDLFGALRRFTGAGGAVILISHKLDEVLEHSDRIVVMRRGEVVGETWPREADRRRLVNLMVGKEVELQLDKPETARGSERLTADAVSAVDHRGVARLRDVSLSVHAGEIVAIAGVEGNGQLELAGVVTGMLAPSAGRVLLDGADITASSVAARRTRGLRYVPEDRHNTGLVLEFDVAENAILRSWGDPDFTTAGLLRHRRIAAFGARLVREHDVRVGSVRGTVRNLSGGNQQKIVLGRETDGELRCLVASQATRGLDAMTARAVLGRLVALRDAGAAVLYLASDLDEVLSLGDRVAVLYEGRLFGPFDRADVDRETLGTLMATGSTGEGDDA